MHKGREHMDRKGIHDLIDRLPESVIPDVRLALETLAMESNVRRYKEGQSVRLRNRDVIQLIAEVLASTPVPVEPAKAER